MEVEERGYRTSTVVLCGRWTSRDDATSRVTLASSVSARSPRRSSPASAKEREPRPPSTCPREAPSGRADSPLAIRPSTSSTDPQHDLARAIFDPLGGVIAVDDERAFDALSASTATFAAHLAYLDAISRWLADRGIPKDVARRYVGAAFGALSGTLSGTQPNDFSALADEYATAGGINEQFLTALRRAGAFNIVDRALDDVAHRLEGE